MPVALYGKSRLALAVTSLFLAGICIGACALYAIMTLTIPVQVNEPLEVQYYPHSLSLYPGENIRFNVTIFNHASLNYTVFLGLSLDNLTYQQEFARFSEIDYVVHSGVQNLFAWLNISSAAPAKTCVLNVDIYRKEYSGGSDNEQIVITNMEFIGTNNIIRVTLNNTGTSAVTINEAWINNVRKTATYPTLPMTIAANSGVRLNITSTWAAGSNYQVKLVSSKGNQFYDNAVAPQT